MFVFLWDRLFSFFVICPVVGILILYLALTCGVVCLSGVLFNMGCFVLFFFFFEAQELAFGLRSIPKNYFS